MPCKISFILISCYIKTVPAYRHFCPYRRNCFYFYMILLRQSSLTLLPTETYQSSFSAVPLLPAPAVRAVPASVFLHIITIRCQAVCKHHAAFAIGLFVQIVPLSVHEYPAALHACLRIKIEPAAISAVADPSGRCVAVLAESPPVSIDRNPLMRSSNSSDNHCQSHKAVFFPSRLPSWYYEGSNIFKFPHTSQIAQVLHSTRLGGTYGILFTTG